jgi:hypothetical protein
VFFGFIVYHREAKRRMGLTLLLCVHLGARREMRDPEGSHYNDTHSSLRAPINRDEANLLNTVLPSVS